LKRRGLLSRLGVALAVTAVAVTAAWLWSVSQGSAAAGSMSLSAAGTGVVCDDPLHPTACSVPRGGAFTLSVAIDSLPDAPYGGIQAQVVYRPLTYQPAGTADAEIVWPDASTEAGFQDRNPPSPTGLEGIIVHTAATGSTLTSRCRRAPLWERW